MKRGNLPGFRLRPHPYEIFPYYDIQQAVTQDQVSIRPGPLTKGFRFYFGRRPSGLLSLPLVFSGYLYYPDAVLCLSATPISAMPARTGRSAASGISSDS